MDQNKVRKSLPQAAFDSYSVLVDNPYALLTFVVALFCIIAEANNSYGPLELIHNALVEYCQGDGKLKAFASIMLYIVDLIIPIKLQFFISLMFLVPAFIKNDTSTWLCSLAFVALTIFTSIPSWQLFLFSQAYYMYCFVESSFYKFLIFFVAFIVLVLGFQHFTSIVGIS
ncbi:MAG: hypothetical protein 4 [Zeugodacus cucurbitae negev-like virus]|nr:MAG: hypothetical protein 4 [Zeugodacus cucurbitae negev-like virus]